MAIIYLWQYPHENVGEALGRFEALLADQAASLSSAFGRSFRHTAKRVGNVLVGQVDHADADGILGWRSWVDHGSCGIAWSGICEDHLGADSDESVTRALHQTALQNPQRIGAMRGNFLLVSWDDGSGCVCITTGDTMSPPLWWMSGPDGWACGSRAAPLFGLVGSQPQLDSASASLFLVSSYHVSGGTFFTGTERIGTRQQVIVQRGREVQVRDYLSATEYLLKDGDRQADVEETVRDCADVLVERTRQQIGFSGNPVLELTGGEDSRCIGAAVFRGGGKVRAHTGGGPGSLEVRIARSLAQAFGFDHSVETLDQDRLSVLLAHRDEARRWLRFSEGLETIRQGLHWERFFSGTLPVFAEESQFFSGLQTGLPHAVVSPSAEDQFRNLPAALTRHGAAKELLGEVVSATDEVTAAVSGKPRDGDDVMWRKLFYWQRRCSVWSFNVMSIKYPAAWYWAPLIDSTLIRCSFRLMRERRLPSDFMYLITRHNAPHVSSIKYLSELSRKSLLSRAVGKAWRLTGGRVFAAPRARAKTTYDPQYFLISPRRPEMWRAFFADNDYAWKDLIDARYVFELMERDPQAQLLWNLATAELVAQEFF